MVILLILLFILQLARETYMQIEEFNEQKSIKARLLDWACIITPVVCIIALLINVLITQNDMGKYPITMLTILAMILFSVRNSRIVKAEETKKKSKKEIFTRVSYAVLFSGLFLFIFFGSRYSVSYVELGNGLTWKKAYASSKHDSKTVITKNGKIIFDPDGHFWLWGKYPYIFGYYISISRVKDDSGSPQNPPEFVRDVTWFLFDFQIEEMEYSETFHLGTQDKIVLTLPEETLREIRKEYSISINPGDFILFEFLKGKWEDPTTKLEALRNALKAPSN